MMKYMPTLQAIDVEQFVVCPKFVLLTLKVACTRRSRAFSGIGIFINPGVATDTDHGVLLLWKYLALDAAAFWPGERSKRIEFTPSSSRGQAEIQLNSTAGIMGLLLLVSMFSVLFFQLVDLSETTVLVEPTAASIPAAAPSPSSAPPAPAPIQVSPTPDSGVGTIVTRQLFDELYPNRNKTFYTYDAFIVAAKSFPTFGNQGSHKIRLREIAAYSAHVQQETAGLFYVEEIDQSFNYCDNTSTEYPCAPGQSYFGRGPLQLSWNYNYGPASAAVGANILADPNLVSEDPVIAFKTSFWFWTTPSGTIPSIHEVLVGEWKPTEADIEAGRKPGFGVTIDIINGAIECGKVTPQAQNRILYFKEFCKFLNVSTGPNLSCAHMQPF